MPSSTRFVTCTAVTIVTLALAPVPGAAQGGPPPVDEVEACPSDSVAFHACAMEKIQTYEPPRTRDGHPDLGGYWLGRHNGAAYDVEPGEGGFAISPSSGVIVDTPGRKIPYQPWALARRNQLRERSYDDPQAHCAPSGAPRKIFTNYGWKILQVPDAVVILFESMHDYRVIPTDGRSHLPERIKLWHGDPVGRWEGDTLVVDYANLNGKHWLDMSGNFTTENLRVVERYTLIDANTIHFEARLEDPTIYTRPWTLVIPLVRNAEPGYYQVEYACHEGERDLQHFTEDEKN